jgi:hypothetical protein
LIDEVVANAPEELRSNLNRLVTTALREYAERRKKDAFARAVAEMAQDPAVRSECDAIEREFMPTELDGIARDDDSSR